MGRKLIFMAVIILITGLYSSCKKGDEDPAISLLSRKERVCGKWKVAEGKVTYGTPDIIESDIFNEKGKLVVQLSQGSVEGTYSWLWEINKNGSYKIYKNMTAQYNPTFTMDEQGYWYFLSRSKEAHIKNKECIAFQPLTITENSVSYEYQTADPVVYNIIQLKNKKIRLEGDRDYKKTDGTAITEFVMHEDINLIPQDK